MAVGHVNHARQVAADQRLQRGAQFGEALRQVAVESCAAPAAHVLIKPPWLNSTRSTPAVTITSATRPENLMSLAPTVSRTGRACARAAACARRSSASLQLRDLRRHRAGAAPLRRAVACALRLEQAVLDGGAGAGERQERHGDVLVFHRERKRGAKLIAVERAVAGRRHPARAVARPIADARERRVQPDFPRRPCRRCSRRGSAGNIRSSPCRGSAGSRSLRRPVRSRRSGLPSPAATESPSPAISRSRTTISVETLSTLRSGRVMPTAAMVGLP